MSLKELREKHPTFTYESYHIKKKGNGLYIKFLFRLGPNIEFKPGLFIPKVKLTNLSEIENFVFHLGLIESISYWKSACSPKFIVKAGNLLPEQLVWWKDLIFNGLGEFFYRNGIRPSSDFVELLSDSNQGLPMVNNHNLVGDLILTSGGKDSAVTLEILSKIRHQQLHLLINPTEAAIQNVKLAGHKNSLTIIRDIDPKLLELNQKKYLNGHTPFSAYLAFLGILVAHVLRYKSVIVSNERSSNEANIDSNNYIINHQYSKSYEFEKKFKDYLSKFLVKKIDYFSFLRPLYDLQVAQLFSGYAKYHTIFRSCNRGQKDNTWCGNCPKCAFSFLVLFPFLDMEQILLIFGENYFQKVGLREFFYMLVGLRKNKPFECVGTYNESILAIALSIKKYGNNGKDTIPQLLTELEDALKLSDNKIKELENLVLNAWNNENFLPQEFATILKQTYGRVKR